MWLALREEVNAEFQSLEGHIDWEVHEERNLTLGCNARGGKTLYRRNLVVMTSRYHRWRQSLREPTVVKPKKSQKAYMLEYVKRPEAYAKHLERAREYRERNRAIINQRNREKYHARKVVNEGSHA